MGGNSAPVFQSPEHDLDPVAAFVAALVVLDGLAARLSNRDAGLYPLVFQRMSEPISIVAPICQQPLRLRQAAQQGRSTCVIADLTCGHEEADRASLGIRHSVQLGVHPAFGSSDQTAPFVVGPPFFARMFDIRYRAGPSFRSNILILVDVPRWQRPRQ